MLDFIARILELLVPLIPLAAIIVGPVNVLLAALTVLVPWLWDQWRARSVRAEADSRARQEALDEERGETKVQIIEAVWGRMALALQPSDFAKELTAHTAWSSAKARWLSLPVSKDQNLLCIWLDLELEFWDSRDDELAWRDLAVQYGYLTQKINGWINGDEEAIQEVHSATNILREQLWSEDDALSGGIVVPNARTGGEARK